MSGWAAEFQPWPQPVNLKLLESFRFADGRGSGWPRVQVIPISGNKLAYILKMRYVVFCMVQIVIYGWVNSWGVFRPTAMFHAALQEFGREVDGEEFSVGAHEWGVWPMKPVAPPRPLRSQRVGSGRR